MPHPVKPKLIAYRLWQTTLDQTLSCKTEKWCQFLSHAKVKLHEKKFIYVINTYKILWVTKRTVVNSENYFNEI